MTICSRSVAQPTGNVADWDFLQLAGLPAEGGQQVRFVFAFGEQNLNEIIHDEFLVEGAGAVLGVVLGVGFYTCGPSLRIRPIHQLLLKLRLSATDLECQWF